MYPADGSHMKYLRKAHYYCKKACDYMEKAMRCHRPCGSNPCHDDRYGESCRPRRYSEYRRNPCHMGSSSCYTFADSENLLDT